MKTAIVFALVLIVAVPGFVFAERIHVGVITGGYEFPREFWALFSEHEEWELTHLAHPKAYQIFADGSAEMFDVLVLFDLCQEMSDVRKRGLMNYLFSGKGLVVIHQALASHQEWPEYREIIGGQFLINEKQIGEQTYPPSQKKEEVIIPIQVADPAHPLVQGLPKTFTLMDERFEGVYLHPNSKPILKTDDPHSMPVLAWVKEYKNNKIFTIQCGQDKSTFLDPNYRTLIGNAIRWAAEVRASEEQQVQAFIKRYDRLWSVGAYKEAMDMYMVGSSSFWWGDYGYELKKYETKQDIQEYVDSIEYYKKQGYKEKTKNKNVNVTILPGGQSALVVSYGSSEATFPDSGKNAFIQYRTTRVLVKKEGEWKILHEHFSPLGIQQY